MKFLIAIVIIFVLSELYCKYQDFRKDDRDSGYKLKFIDWLRRKK